MALVLSLQAATVPFAKVERDGKVFYMDSIIEVQVPRTIMLDLLTDYDRMQQFSNGFVESKHFPKDDDGLEKVYMHLKGCVTFFCRHVKKMESLVIDDTESELTTITTVLIPEESYNVKKLNSQWKLSDIQIPFLNNEAQFSSVKFTDEQKESVVYKQGTKIRYTMEFQPGFWVPPVIGGYLVKKAMVSDGTEILNRMEAYAHKELMQPNLIQPNLIQPESVVSKSQ